MARRVSTQAFKRAIIEALKEYPRSINTLADDLGINYYTVRRIVNDDLLVNKEVKIIDTVDRHAIYEYCGVETEGDYIPRVVDIANKGSMKVLGILPAVGNEDSMKTVKSMRNLPRHVTDLMYYASLANDGSPVGQELSDLRTRIQRDYVSAENGANFYKQILQEARFWDVKTLAKMAEDREWDLSLVLNSKQYYSNGDGNV